MVSFEVDGHASAKGAWKEGAPSAGNRNEKQLRTKRYLRKRNIIFALME